MLQNMIRCDITGSEVLLPPLFLFPVAVFRAYSSQCSETEQHHFPHRLYPSQYSHPQRLLPRFSSVLGDSENLIDGESRKSSHTNPRRVPLLFFFFLPQICTCTGSVQSKHCIWCPFKTPTWCSSFCRMSAMGMLAICHFFFLFFRNSLSNNQIGLDVPDM